MSEKRILKYKILALSLILGLIIGLGAYLYKQHLDRIHEEEIKKPYKEAGLSDKQANEFIAKYPEQNGNSTWVSFAKAWVNDPSLADKSLKTFGNLKDSLDYMYFVNNNGYDGLNYLENLPKFAEKYKEVLPAYSANSSLVKIVYDQFQRDPRISVDRNDLFLKSLKEYQDLNLIKKNLMIQTVHAVNNLTLAYQQGLPRLDKDSAWLLTNATQISKDIVDFEPVIIKDVDGNKIVIQSQNLSRDYWMVANLLKERPALASQAEKFEWLNRMIQQVAWDIFDYEYGPKYFDKKSYKPNDPEVWQVILGFHDYMDALPAKLEKDGIPIAFPYWDSSLLKQQIADKTNRTIALFYLADLPAKTMNKTYATELGRLAQERKITSAEYDRLYQEKAVVKGIEGMKLFIQQLPKEYDEIVKTYKDPVLKGECIRRGFYGIFGDRRNSGLKNTIEGFTGHFTGTERIDEVLDKYWKKEWEIIKVVDGYEWLNFPSGDAETMAYGIPLARKAMGIPLGWIGGRPLPVGAGSIPGYTLPDNVLQIVHQAFADKNIVSFVNFINPCSCIQEAERDGTKEVFSGLRGLTVYLWKK
jgi:hypothetical protein